MMLKSSAGSPLEHQAPVSRIVELQWHIWLELEKAIRWRWWQALASASLRLWLDLHSSEEFNWPKYISPLEGLIDEGSVLRTVMANSRLTALLILAFMVLAPYSSTISTVPFIGIDEGEEKVDIIAREMWQMKDNGIVLNEAQEAAFSATGLGRGTNASWSAAGGSEDRDFIYEMVEDSDGSIIVAGSIFVDCWLGSIIVQTEGLGDIIVAKLDRNGTWLWAKSAGTAIAYDEARGVDIDDDGDIYICLLYTSPSPRD